MTEPDDGQDTTRPISVAELLAKNGTIGSPPVSGRRRRRRGNSDAVTVAELTGEIPIVRLDEDGALLGIDDVDEGYADFDEAHDYVPSRLEPAPDPMPHRGSDTAPELSHYPRPRPPAAAGTTADGSGVETVNPDEMTPDPADDAPVVVHTSGDDELGIGVVADADDDAVVAEEPGLFSGDALFGSDTVETVDTDTGDTVEPIAGDLSDVLVGDADEYAPAADEYSAVEEDGYEDGYEAVYDYYDETTRGQSILRGVGIALQSVLTVALGAGLFLAFARLWEWNSLIAMVLSILATLGLVAGVWVVRRTEDIASTLIAVGVGLLVTFGPLALMHATN